MRPLMGDLWNKIKTAASRRIVLICVTVMDSAVLLVLFLVLIGVDIAKSWLLRKMGLGGLPTQVTLGIVEVLFDLCLINHVFGWLWGDFRCILRGDCRPNDI
jgi:hypothetical protein